MTATATTEAQVLTDEVVRLNGLVDGLNAEVRGLKQEREVLLSRLQDQDKQLDLLLAESQHMDADGENLAQGRLRSTQ